MQLHVSVMFNMHKKWSGSVVYAATETRENVTKPVTETQVIRRVFQNGFSTFPFTDSCNFVLCWLCAHFDLRKQKYSLLL